MRSGQNYTLPLFGDTLKRFTATMAAWMLFTATDLFCGASGVGTGFAKAKVEGRPIVRVVQGVNHDPVAIASSKANYGRVRFYLEDITQLNANRLIRTAILWASLECTNFSNAKGGQSRDADSRSLADHMERYILALRPLYFLVENVREFMSWGELVHATDKYGQPKFRRVKVLVQRTHPKTGKPLVGNKTGKPLMRQVVNEAGELVWENEPVMVPASRKKGRDFIRWKQGIEDLGYTCAYKVMDSADYGERTSRKRLYMIFAKNGLPIRWPQPTHSKGGKTLGTEPWLPVRPCLKLEQKGTSIFGRAVPLVEKTLKRIYAGLCKYIAGQKVEVVTKWLAQLAAGNFGGTLPTAGQVQPEWLAKRTSNPPSGQANPGASLDEPAPTVATGFQPDLVQAEFLTKAFTGDATHLVQGTDVPAGTLTTVDHHQLVQTDFLTTRHHGNEESRARSLDAPAATITTNDHHTLVQAEFLVPQFSTSEPSSVDEPAGTVTTNPRARVVQAEFLTNPGWQGGNTSADVPAHTIVARQDKVPMQLVQPEFLMQSNGGPASSKVTATSAPARTVLASPNQALVQPEFLTQYNGNITETRIHSLEEPCNTLSTENRFGLVQPEFLQKYYGTGDNVTGTDEPAGTLTTKDRMGLVQTEFLDKYYGTGERSQQTLNVPASSITGSGNHHALVQAEPWLMDTSFDNDGRPLDEPARTVTASRHHPYLITPEPDQFLLDNKFNNVGRGLEQPGPTLLTGDHHYLISPELASNEPYHWQPQPDDSETMSLIRQFMRAFGLSDVLLRMLLVEELLKIQGFPDDYVLLGSTTDQKKFIGNSVTPKVPQLMAEALYEGMRDADLLHLLAEYDGGLAVDESGQLIPSEQEALVA